MKSLLLDNEDLVKVGYYGVMRFAKQNGLWDDKDERLYFQGQSITVNLIPQALFLLGWIARNINIISYNLSISISVKLLIYYRVFQKNCAMFCYMSL